MGWFILLLCGVLPVLAADPVQSALSMRAQSDFDRVAQASAPGLETASQCVQSQAAVAPVTAPETAPLIRFRQGYCALTAALLSRDRRLFDDAGRAFDASLAAWAARPRDKKAPPEPDAAAVQALAGIARLAGGAEGDAMDAAAVRLDMARKSGACPSAVMPVQDCREILSVAAVWQGWVEVRRNRLAEAALLFSPEKNPGWRAWVDGRRAFERRQYGEAAGAYARAVEWWTAEEKGRRVRIPEGLVPTPDIASALTDLGGARIAAGDARGAIPALDIAVRRGPAQALAWYLRGRARELTGDPGGALADYNVAGRTALATVGEQSAGEGRFYRGIWNYRRGNSEAAEEEFTEAQNAGAPSWLSADLAAWRALAAVAGGSCGASREKLESAAAAASPLFPKTEANAAMASCGPSPTRLSEAR